MNDFFNELYQEFLNGGHPVESPLPDWHEIKAWAESLLAVNRNERKQK